MFKKDKPTGVINNPYENARREWDERYGDLITRAKNWRLIAVLLAATLVLAVGGLVAVAMQSKIVPYVVVADDLGRLTSGGFASAPSVADDKIKRAMLYTWIEDLRTVASDGILQRKMIDRVYAHIGAGSTAETMVSEFYRSAPPGERAQTNIVTVEVPTVFISTKDTYEVEWEETKRDIRGALIEKERYKGSVTLVVKPPSDEINIRKNPLGIYVVAFSSSKVLKL